MLIDTHCHLNFAAYRDDLEEVAAGIIRDGMKVINVGSQLSTSERAVALAERYPGNFFAAVGLHPIHLFEMEVDEVEIPFTSRQEEFSAEAYENLARHEKVVAMGEIGLDYFHMPADIKIREFEAKQQWAFLRQLELARKLQLPVILHCRGSRDNPGKSYLDLLRVLKESKVTQAVIHCFTADWEIAKKFLDAGCLLSFTGIITYPKTHQLATVVKKAPLDRIMIETDAPYLAPQLVRGKRNEPRFVRYVADRIAQIRGVEYEVIEQATTNNAIKFFRLR